MSTNKVLPVVMAAFLLIATVSATVSRAIVSRAIDIVGEANIGEAKVTVAATAPHSELRLL